uniref:Release factor glutamine methyltransferase n=2 Tax=Thermorudis TaxID=1649508 RepID=A0A831X1L2_9BACT
MARPTISILLRRASERLRSAGLETPRVDAEILLMAVLDQDRAGLYRNLREPVSPEAADRFLELVERRARGEPVAYLTGRREFYGLEFLVTPAVLIPRPETEFLVTWATERLSQRAQRSICVDVGTGCGAVVVALAHRLGPAWDGLLIGSDISRPALEVARANRDRLAPRRVELICGDLLDWCRGPLDLITANLPYLRPDQAHSGLAFEPPQALYAGEDGFALYRRLLRQAAALLRPDGGIICEIDPDQRQLARETAQALFPAARIQVLPDLSGLDRYLTIELAENTRTTESTGDETGACPASGTAEPETDTAKGATR